MDYGLIFRKTSTCYKNPDIEYLDETSDYKLKVMAKSQGVAVEELRVRNEEINNSISYLTKENHGRVYAGGFLRDMLLSKKAIAPEKWNNEIRKKAITSSIFKNIREFGSYRGGVGHKLVFSMSKEMEETIEKSNLNPDELLGKEVKKIMYQFQKCFHPGEKIGFAWGIHHDTKHRHIHIYLCNRTDKGNHVAMSSPLQGRRRKYQQKDQIGYIKGQVIKAQKRILDQVKESNCNRLTGKESSILIPLFDASGLDKFSEEEERLERQRQSIVAQENALKLHQEMIRRQYTDYNLKKDLIAEGYKDLKNINQKISESYQSLRQSNTVISTQTLKQLGIFPRSGPLKHFCKFLFAIHNSLERNKREAIFQQINESREYKSRLVSQLQSMDWQRKSFLKDVEEMKQKREELRREFFRARYQYERSLLRHNFNFFMRTVRDEQKKDRYNEITKRLWRKRRAREDSSSELELIKKFDLEARSKVLII